MGDSVIRKVTSKRSLTSIQNCMYWWSGVWTDFRAQRTLSPNSCVKLLRNVPEGRCDRSLARSAWDSATPREPSRRVRCDSCRCAHRFEERAIIEQQLEHHRTRTFQEEYLASVKRHGPHFDEKYLWISCGRSYRTLRDGSFEGRFPRHFVPGYDRCVPTGHAGRHFAALAKYNYSEIQRRIWPKTAVKRIAPGSLDGIRHRNSKHEY